MKKFITHIALVLLLLSSTCNHPDKKEVEDDPQEIVDVKPTADSGNVVIDSNLVPSSNSIDTKEANPGEILAYARTLIGVPYLYASTDPEKGFDCSGFITHVFNHFNIKVPRSSVDFTNQGEEVDLDEAAPGDLILFTGTDSSVRVVGHMGLVEERRNDSLFFIHSSSGKANGVIISSLERYYQGRFVKTIRVFPERFFE